MPRILERALSPTFVRTAPVGMHCDGRGLYLQVTEGKDGKLNRSWIFRYRVNGRTRDMGLGPVATLSLTEAREKAKARRQERLDKIDPLEAQRARAAEEAVAAAKTMTFKQCAEVYIKAHRVEWRNAKHAGQWETTLAIYADPVIGALPVQAIDTTLVMKVLEPIWSAKTETASRLRGRIEAILNWAKAKGLRQGENPAQWKGHLENLLPERSEAVHLPALPYDKLPSFMAALRAQEGTAARALEFAVLTACRTGEVLGATWNEIDFTARLWTVPANRTKRNRKHEVPLSDAAIAVLNTMADDDDRVFPVKDAAMRLCLKELRSDVSVHGFRATFRSWSGGCTGHPRDVCEMALGHAVGDATEQAYMRDALLAKRRVLMTDWADFCAKPEVSVTTIARERRS